MQQVIDALIPIIVVIAVISGIVGSIKESIASKSKSKSAAPPPSGPRSRAQSEIAAFLSGKPTSPEVECLPEPAPRTLVSQQSARTVPVVGAPQQQKPKSKKQKNPKPKASPGRPVEQNARSERPTGSSIKAHVDSFIGQHVSSHMGRDVDAFVARDIDDRVKSHLGSQAKSATDAEQVVEPDATTAGRLLLALRSPQGVRQAILVNEILSRPKSLRK